MRCHSELTLGALTVPVGTPCEIQIKTILQHAYSELTHDTIYKPKVDATPKMRRTAAKSMALIEATNDYFQQVVSRSLNLSDQNKTATDEMAEVYRKQIGKEPETTRAEGLLLEAFDIDAIKRMPELLTIFLSNKQFLKNEFPKSAIQTAVPATGNFSGLYVGT